MCAFAKRDDVLGNYEDLLAVEQDVGLQFRPVHMLIIIIMFMDTWPLNPNQALVAKADGGNCRMAFNTDVHPRKLIRSLQLGLASQHPALFKPNTSTSALWKLEVGSKSDFEPCWIEWWGSPPYHWPQLLYNSIWKHWVVSLTLCLSSTSYFHSNSSCQPAWRMGMASFWMSLKEAVCLLRSLAGHLLINQFISTFSAHAIAQNISWSHSAHRSMLWGPGALGDFAFVKDAFVDPFVFLSSSHCKCNWYSSEALLLGHAQNDLSNQQLLSACGCMRGMLIENEPSL